MLYAYANRIGAIETELVLFAVHEKIKSKTLKYCTNNSVTKSGSTWLVNLRGPPLPHKAQNVGTIPNFLCLARALHRRFASRCVGVFFRFRLVPDGSPEDREVPHSGDAPADKIPECNFSSMDSMLCAEGSNDASIACAAIELATCGTTFEASSGMDEGSDGSLTSARPCNAGGQSERCCPPSSSWD